MPISRRIQLALLFSTLIGGMLFAYLFYSHTGSFYLDRQDYRHLVFAWALSNLAGLGMFLLSRWLNQMAPWHLATALRFLIELVVLALFTGLLTAAAGRLYLLALDISPASFYQAYHDPLIKGMILGVVILFIYTILDFTWYTYNQYAALQIEQVKRTSTQLELQLEVLKSQLSPHYLFNSLNTISSLMYQDPEKAEEFIRKLAHTYQYVMATQEQPLVPLHEEIRFLQAYFFLLKARFEQAVHLSLDLPRRALNSKIPPLTLQLLLENAVKHNAPTDEAPLFVRIYLSDKNHLAVRNNILAGGSRLQSFKVGLDNIRLRYQYYAQAAISVVKSDEFVVELPLLYPHPSLYPQASRL
ncbi:MAG: sensor histidine kinase [Adhaeribacter sp.]